MKINQFGRSMIEMLGVLAIIGVLSVGGISGYTEAMRKYKMNKTIEIFRASLFRLMELDQIKQKNGEEMNDDVDLYVTLGLLPEDICDKNYVNIEGHTGESCQLPVGEIGMDFIFGESGDVPMRGEYYITFTDGDKERNCVDFLSYHWEKITPKEWWKPNFSDATGGSIWVGSPWKTIYAGNQEYGPTELTMDNIAKACHDACKGESCGVEMVFRQEI